MALEISDSDLHTRVAPPAGAGPNLEAQQKQVNNRLSAITQKSDTNLSHSLPAQLPCLCRAQSQRPEQARGPSAVSAKQRMEDAMMQVPTSVFAFWHVSSLRCICSLQHSTAFPCHRCTGHHLLPHILQVVQKKFREDDAAHAGTEGH